MPGFMEIIKATLAPLGTTILALMVASEHRDRPSFQGLWPSLRPSWTIVRPYGDHQESSCLKTVSCQGGHKYAQLRYASRASIPATEMACTIPVDVLGTKEEGIIVISDDTIH